MSRTIQFMEKEWTVEMTGGGHGAGAMFNPPLKYTVIFTCASGKPNEVHQGSLPEKELSAHSDEQLIRTLDRAIQSARDKGG